MKNWILAILAVLGMLLCCIACSSSEGEGAYQLYFLTDPQETSGSALDTQPFGQADCRVRHAQEEACPTPGCLLSALLAGPEGQGLVSPFPNGTAVRGWSWDESRPGCLRVTLSEQYGGLVDVSMTLADHCIMLTLGQLEGVETVELRVAGGQAERELSVEEALLDNGLSALA